METANRPTCEVELLSPHLDHIPDDCQTRTIKAVIETWRYIGDNHWIYVLQIPTTLTIICDNPNDHIKDVVLHKTGIVKLEGLCKGYINLYCLEPTKKYQKNVTHYIPSINIIDSDCCLIAPEFEKLHTQQMKPVHLTNVDLSSLRYANKKLEEFDEILTRRINEPYTVSHAKWYTIILSVLGSLIFLIFCYNCCRHCGCLRFLKRLCCFTKDPRNGETIPPMIKNFVNCTFDSNYRTKYQGSSMEIVARISENETTRSRMITQEMPEETENEEQEFSANLKTRLPLSRRSATPM